MLDYIKLLSEEEKQIVLLSPVYVSLLIAGADGHFDSDEKKRILELIHIKTFSERYELTMLYTELETEANLQLRNMIASLPEDTQERNQLLSDLIARLNTILPKMEPIFAIQLYDSLRQFAHYIANADGGWWGISAIGAAEREFVKLPMLDKPAFTGQ